MNYKTPGVYIEEIPKFPPSIAQVETAIPGFIGYTEKALDARNNPLLLQPFRITSLFEYERFFGSADVEKNITVSILERAGKRFDVIGAVGDRSPYKMYYGLQMFFANGGGPCWIISTGDYSTQQVGFAELMKGLEASEKIDEITLYVYPYAQRLTSVDDFYTLFGESMDMCEKLKDRFSVMDIWPDPDNPDFFENVKTMRDKTPNEENTLKYGAVYGPDLETILDLYYGGEGNGDANVAVVHTGGDGSLNGTLGELKSKNNALYFQARSAVRNIPNLMPPSSAVVGVYANVDSSRGVWKAPANVNIDFVIKPVLKITNSEQEDLNVDIVAGKSVNIILSQTGRGPAIIWGARTLAGNSNEWRYIPVRRFFNMVEESVSKASAQFVFEPNDLNTWTRVQSTINNFLVQQWRAGALMGTTPEQAFYVNVGLGETMDEVDIWEGRMIVEIGMAVVRPAEFIILRFSHKMVGS